MLGWEGGLVYLEVGCAHEEQEVEPARPSDSCVERAKTVGGDDEDARLLPTQVVELCEHGRGEHAALHAETGVLSVQTKLLCDDEG